MNLLRESELPFKIKRKDRPKIIYRPKRIHRHGNFAAYYPKRQVVEVYASQGKARSAGRDLSVIIEHEIAHHQIMDRRRLVRNGYHYNDFIDLVDMEMQADILAYHRTGKVSFDTKKDFAYSGVIIGLLNLYTKEDDAESTPMQRLEYVAKIIKGLADSYREYMPAEWYASCMNTVNMMRHNKEFREDVKNRKYEKRLECEY